MTQPFVRILLLLAYVSMPYVALADTVSEELTKIEQNIFAVSFDNESLEARVKRLEVNVFGAEQVGDISNREARLVQIFKAQLEASSQPEQTDTQTQEASPPPVQDEPVTKNTDATDYPAVTALERVVFSRDFIYDDVNSRIARLERRTFNQEYPNLALVDRLDRLQARYPAAQPDTRMIGSGGDAPATSAIDKLPASSRQFVGSGDVYAKLDALEGALIPDQRNGHMMITERLDKLEAVAFGYKHSGESVDMRLNRLLQGYQTRYAKPNYNQSSYAATNTFDGITPNQPPREISSYRPNIQIGAGMMSTTQSSMGGGFSPEMMSIIRQQTGSNTTSMPSQQYSSTTQYNNGWGGTTQSSSTSTVFGPPGTTITEERTVMQPTYSYNNGYNMVPGYAPTQPGVTYQSYTTTVDQFGNRVRTPVAYMGNPQVLQQLADTEIRVFGQVNTADTMPMRLMMLENKVLGQSYPGYSDVDRLNNINKGLQYQSLGKTFGNSKAADIGRSAGSMLLGIPLAPPGQ